MSSTVNPIEISNTYSKNGFYSTFYADSTIIEKLEQVERSAKKIEEFNASVSRVNTKSPFLKKDISKTIDTLFANNFLKQTKNKTVSRHSSTSSSNRDQLYSLFGVEQVSLLPPSELVKIRAKVFQDQKILDEMAKAENEMSLRFHLSPKAKVFTPRENRSPGKTKNLYKPRKMTEGEKQLSRKSIFFPPSLGEIGAPKELNSISSEKIEIMQVLAEFCSKKTLLEEEESNTFLGFNDNPTFYPYKKVYGIREITLPKKMGGKVSVRRSI